MEDVTIAEAKEKLEDLVARAAHGEDVRISDPQLGTVRLLAVDASPKSLPERRPGRWKDRLTVPARLMEPLTDEELAWLSGETSA